MIFFFFLRKKGSNLTGLSDLLRKQEGKLGTDVWDVLKVFSTFTVEHFSYFI